MIIAIIPAKKDSKRLPGKNMRSLLGRPMLDYAIDYAKQSRRVSKIYVSTDDNTISDYSKSNAVDVIKRPATLVGETALLDVYKHVLSELFSENVETVVSVQVDHPDRSISLDEALKIYEDQGLDYLYSTDANGTKNGAHFIVSVEGILNNKFEKQGHIVDNCTNIHFESDLLNAEKRMKAMGLGRHT